MITATSVSKKGQKVDVLGFEKRVKNIPVDHPLYDEVFIVFVTYDDGDGDYGYIEDRCLYLVLHTKPKCLLKTFEKNFALARA
ncbi:MAG: hypothetical protein DWQ02_25225 [Bacteroidetes bacterium]|nr:MAG: hypothetical protein DWQ02_25225 [Bacteroidota bacterium]